MVTDGEIATEQAVVDMLLDAAMDLRNGVVRLCYNKDYVRVLKVAVIAACFKISVNILPL